LGIERTKILFDEMAPFGSKLPMVSSGLDEIEECFTPLLLLGSEDVNESTFHRSSGIFVEAHLLLASISQNDCAEVASCGYLKDSPTTAIGSKIS
jgi:hypothetical protein